MADDDRIETEDLGGGFALRLEDTSDYTTHATLVRPDGGEEVIICGSESECPEDMIWCRDLGSIFRHGLGTGKAIGKAEAREELREPLTAAMVMLGEDIKAGRYALGQLLKSLVEAPGEAS